MNTDSFFITPLFAFPDDICGTLFDLCALCKHNIIVFNNHRNLSTSLSLYRFEKVTILIFEGLRALCNESQCIFLRIQTALCAFLTRKSFI